MIQRRDAELKALLQEYRKREREGRTRTRSPDYLPNGRRKYSSERTAYLYARLFTSMW